MKTRLSTKGQVVLPGPVRRKLGLQPGDSLDVAVNSGRITLTPDRPPKLKPRIVKDPVLGTPVLTFGPAAPKLTSAQVREILDEFP